MWVAAQVAAHSDVATLIVIGKTYNDQEILGVSLGAPDKPKVYLHCTIHAREWIATTTCLVIIDQLLNKDADRATLLNNFNWIIVPVHNIDGYDWSHTNDRLWRKNREPNAGSNCVGTDINRNYAYGWGGVGADTRPCGETYRGSKAVSSSEAKAEIDFINQYFDTGSMAAYFDIHSYGGWFLSPWGYTDEIPSDYSQMEPNMVAASHAIYNVNKHVYVYGPSGSTLYPTSGGTTDYTYGAGGVIDSYVIECFGSSFTAPVSWILPIGNEVWTGVKTVVQLL